MPVITWETSSIDNTQVAATAVVSSNPIDISQAEAFSYKITVDAGAAADVALTYQIIDSGQEDVNLVGGAKDTEEGRGWVTPSSGGTLVSSITTGSAAYGFEPVVSQWIRFQVTGAGGNHANTTYITVKIGKQSWGISG